MRQTKTFMLFALGFIILSGFNLGDGNKPSKEALNSITAEDARKHLFFLASDSLMGRDTPSEGLRIAGEYIAQRFQEYGLKPVDGGYFEQWAMNKVQLGEVNFLKIKGKDGVEKSFEIKKEYMPYEMTANKGTGGEIVFTGYGITAPEYGYDDYANIDVKGKIVFVMKRGPQQNNPESPFHVAKDPNYNQIGEKVRNAIEHGAVGIMLVTDPLYNRLLTPRGFPWPSLYKGFPPDAVPLTLAITESKKIPTIQVGEEVINMLFGSVDALKSIQLGIDSTMTPRSYQIPDVNAIIRTSTKVEVRTTRNVVGFMEGADPKLKNEFVVIGAHYDHVGFKRNTPAGQDSICNGADDNASGTTGVLEVAKAFCVNPERPRRSILFITFAGEEKGLYGSQAYTEEPLFPVKQTVAMLNMDMIGRNNPDSLSIGGNTRSPELTKIVEEENKNIGFTLAYNIERYFGNSDQAAFARRKIPVLFFHTGEHPDLHRVSDSPDKINYEKLAHVAKLCFLTAWRVADMEERPTYVEPKKGRK